MDKPNFRESECCFNCYWAIYSKGTYCNFSSDTPINWIETDWAKEHFVEDFMICDNYDE